MTTEPQTPPNDAIPPWFMEFANENTRQHAELASQIADARLETANLRTDMEREFGVLRAEVAEKLGALETRIAENRAETHRDIASLLRWVVGATLGTGVAVVGSLIYAVERLA